MEDIEKIIKKILDSYKDITIRIHENKIVLHRRFLFKIVISNINQKGINIYYDWRVGILGKLFFKKDYLDLLNIFNDIKNTLLRNKFLISTIIKNS
jgi:hypothetical protein